LLERIDEYNACAASRAKRRQLETDPWAGPSRPFDDAGRGNASQETKNAR
jgi:hypothetical protein